MPGTVRVFVDGEEVENLNSPYAKTEDAAIAAGLNSEWNAWIRCGYVGFEEHKSWAEGCTEFLIKYNVVTAAR